MRGGDPVNVAFVANVDAELEWSLGPDYRASPRMRAHARALGSTVGRGLAESLAASVHVIVPDEPTPTLPPCVTTLCWSPTLRAQAAAAAAGAPPTAAPAPEVLARVNHRAFVHALGRGLPGARFVWTIDELDEALAAAPPGRELLCKRPFAFAGRARKRIASGRGRLAGALRTWCEASMREHGRGLLVEPFVQVCADFALHGLVGRSGGVQLGEATVQDIDAAGRWQASRRALADDLHASERMRIEEAARAAAGALADAGYFGPFGIDAYRWAEPGGGTRLQPLSDLNARLTMGFCTGMGPAARALLDVGAG